MKNIIILTLALLVLILGFSTALADKSKTVPAPETINQTPKDNPDAKADPQGVSILMPWYSINAGGASYGTSGSLKLGYSVGQSVAGAGSSGSLKLGVGFWHGAGGCIAKAGDVTGDGIILLPDIIAIINFVFKAGATPNPLCRGDANGNGTVLLNDIVYLISFVFRSGPAPVRTGVCCL
jgi:hypothetical protein